MIAMRWKLVPMFTMNSDKPVEVKRVLQYRESRRYFMCDTTYETFEGVEWRDVPEEHEEVTPL